LPVGGFRGSAREVRSGAGSSIECWSFGGVPNMLVIVSGASTAARTRMRGSGDDA
jgi:hypothetical protein